MADKDKDKGKKKTKRPLHEVEGHAVTRAAAPKKPDVEAHANLKAPVKAPVK